MGMLLTHPGFYSVVAEIDGRVAGSNFLDERSDIVGVGPITVDPDIQGGGIGRLLMEDCLNRVAERGFPGVRLVQEAYNGVSLSLYTKLGFETREPLVLMQGDPLKKEIPGFNVRSANPDDLDACNEIAVKVHGLHRGGELSDAIENRTASVVEREGRITGYTTNLAFHGHSVGETNRDVEALISAAPEFLGSGFLVPMRNGELFRWCLDHGIRVVLPMTLMSVGVYNEPHGAYLPSILY
jgi:GNAT superfamily N-acetyltransferase